MRFGEIAAMRGMPAPKIAFGLFLFIATPTASEEMPAVDSKFIELIDSCGDRCDVPGVTDRFLTDERSNPFISNVITKKVCGYTAWRAREIFADYARGYFNEAGLDVRKISGGSSAIAVYSPAKPSTDDRRSLFRAKADLRSLSSCYITISIVEISAFGGDLTDKSKWDFLRPEFAYDFETGAIDFLLEQREAPPLGLHNFMRPPS